MSSSTGPEIALGLSSPARSPPLVGISMEKSFDPNESKVNASSGVLLAVNRDVPYMISTSPAAAQSKPDESVGVSYMTHPHPPSLRLPYRCDIPDSGSSPLTTTYFQVQHEPHFHKDSHYHYSSKYVANDTNLPLTSPGTPDGAMQDMRSSRGNRTSLKYNNAASIAGRTERSPLEKSHRINESNASSQRKIAGSKTPPAPTAARAIKVDDGAMSLGGIPVASVTLNMQRSYRK